MCRNITHSNILFFTRKPYCLYSTDFTYTSTKETVIQFASKYVLAGTGEKLMSNAYHMNDVKENKYE